MIVSASTITIAGTVLSHNVVSPLCYVLIVADVHFLKFTAACVKYARKLMTIISITVDP